MNIVDAYRDAQDEKLALEWCESTVKAFKGGIGEAAGLFAKVRIHMAAEDWESVLSTLDRLQLLKTFGGKSLAGATNENEVQFLRGLALEKQNRTSEMLTVYLSLKKEDRDYFGWRASDRLSRLLNDSNKPTGSERAKRIKIKSEIEKSLLAREQEEIDPWRLPESIDPNDELVFPKLANPDTRTGNFAKSGSIAYALIDLGLYDEASPELELEMTESESDSNIELRRFDPDIAYKLATYHSKGGFADRAIRYIEPKWKKVHREYPETKIPVDDALLLYPAPFRYHILSYSKQENVDPRYVLSIMRQESRFQADIKSAAAARGLMQFITNTSGKIANELRIENFKQDELYNPETGIRFGAHYISNIFKDFPDKPHAVAASYNGGEDRMARWLRRAKSGDPDQYVSEVLFPQTKDYVYKVMANYRMYRLIYDENLVPRHKIRSSGIR